MTLPENLVNAAAEMLCVPENSEPCEGCKEQATKIVAAVLRALPESEAVRELCGRCKGKGTESWQISRNPADGREDWPCIRCQGRGWVIAPIIAAIAKLADDG